MIWRPTTTPYGLTLAATLTSVSTFIDCYHYAVPISQAHNTLLAFLAGLSLTLSLAILVLTLTYPMQDVLPSPTVAPLWSPPTRSHSSPEDSVTLWNWLTFDYITPLLDRAGTGTLNEEDVWDLPPGFKHANLFGKYLRVTEDEKKRGKKTSLVWFLVASNSQDLIIDVALKMWVAVVGTYDTINMRGREHDLIISIICITVCSWCPVRLRPTLRPPANPLLSRRS